MQKAIWIATMLFVVGCGGSGSNGTQGPAGQNGINGTNGTNGTNGPTYTLEDANGDALPGILVTPTGTNLYDATEGTQTSYSCDQPPGCGIASQYIYFSGTACTGTKYATIGSDLSNVRYVFQEGGNAYVTSGSFSNQTVGSYISDYGTCQASSGTMFVSTVTAYTGVFPRTSPGPWTVVTH